MQSKIWHYITIPYLPDRHLFDLWKKLVLISIELGGRVEDRYGEDCPYIAQVNHVKRYSSRQLAKYIDIVQREITERGFGVTPDSYFQLFKNIKVAENNGLFSEYNPSALYDKWQSDVYLRECLYMLESDYLDDAITDTEWQKIVDRFSNLTPLIDIEQMDEIRNPQPSEKYNLAEL